MLSLRYFKEKIVFLTGKLSRKHDKLVLLCGYLSRFGIRFAELFIVARYLFLCAVYSFVKHTDIFVML